MPSETRVDILIVGAGPAGLMCANALAMAGADVRIIDIRPINVTGGQADGIQPRTIEVLQSYGLAERLIREGNQMTMRAFYNPGNNGIECTGRVLDVTAAASRYPFKIALQQRSVENIFLDSMKNYKVHVERPRRPSAIEISEDPTELTNPSLYPVKVTVEHLDVTDDENKTEIIHAKFVVGADGAHSWVRKTLGIVMEGEQTEYIWGVVDSVPETDFPDIRNCTSIHSANGSAMVIPREGDLVRLYIQLLSDRDAITTPTGRVNKSEMSAEKLLSIARKIFYPYKLDDPKCIEWWTIYIIGQHVASSFSVKGRVFIAGDACHTHSPKAGQGMNASMNDTHNLAWKLAQVVRGWSNPSLLETYEQERRKYAQDLINFDKKWATLFSGKPRMAENEDGVTHEQFLQAFETFGGFSSGIGVHYSPSAIVDTKHQKHAKNLIVGQRMRPQIFVRAADALRTEIHDLLPADIRFKVLFFVGNLTEMRIIELKSLAEELDKSSSFLHKYSPTGEIATVFDVITITTGKKDDIHYNYLLVPAFFRPHWTKVLLDDADAVGSNGGRGYETFGIDPKEITLVIIRPDGYVGTIAPSNALEDLDRYFGSFLIPRGLND